MKNYACHKCGSVDLFLKENGSQKGLYCSEGCGWIKWISKKEMPLVEEFIKENKVNKVTSYVGTTTTVVDRGRVTKEIDSIYGIKTLKDYYKQKKFELELDNNSFNRGIVKGIEIALKIMEVE